MVDIARPDQRRRRVLAQWGVPGVFLAAGLVLVGALYLTVERTEHQRLQLEADITAHQVSLRLEAWLADRMAISHQLASHEFTDQADALARHAEVAARFVRLYPGFQALNYIDPAGIIRVVVPAVPNQAALGMALDQHPYPVVARTARDALSARQPRGTPAIDLFQGGKGFATYQAMRDTADTVIGLVNSVFRIDTLVDTCLHEGALRERFCFTLIDDLGQIVYRHAPAPAAQDDSWQFVAARPLQVADRTWTLRLAPGPAHISQTRTDAVEVLGIVGVLLVAALAALIHILMRRQFALADSRAKYQMLVENQTDLLVKVDPQGHFLYASPSYCELFDREESELLGREFLPLVHEDDREATAQAVARLFEPPHHVTIEQRAMTRHGWRWLHWTDTAVVDTDGKVTAIIGAGRDITRRKELEEQLRQSQKMQAIGQLAGGIAHDFNNLLQAMLGHLELLDGDLAGAPESVQGDLGAVKRSALRAAGLTRQLLAFSRQQVQSVSVHDLSVVVTELAPLLRRLLGDAIELTVSCGEVPVPVQCDRGQLEQVILNLCVNARDAIADSGVIAIEVTSDGRQASLVVADSGHGITPDVRDHIFEPFFTTKDVGKGTGLGLATVYGIVEQHRGSISVESEPGRGSRFRILLPLSDQRPASSRPEDLAAMPRGDETILVAEDEESLRGLMARVLRNAGYRVLTAHDGADAVAQYRQHPDVDLVLLDVVMPRMGGRSAAREMLQRRPDLPVVFVTGHPGRPGTDDEHLLDEAQVLMKPFSASALLGRVRDALDLARSRPAHDA